MAKVNVYQSGGFYLTHTVDIGGLRSYPAALLNFLKGDAIHDDAAGYATNAATAFATTFKGIASEPFDNLNTWTDYLPGHGDHTLSTNLTDPKVANMVLVIPPLAQYQFIVPSYSALITQAAVGTHVDLNRVNCRSVLLTDVAGAASSFLFMIDEIDTSAAALVGNQFGYAIGHFMQVSA